MASVISLVTHSDNRGKITIVEQALPFAIKRIFYVYEMDDSWRAGHRHKRTSLGVTCLQGQCKVWTNNGNRAEEFNLDHPSKCLILEPSDWHQIKAITPNAILMVLASELYDRDDYINTPYS